jgi:ubiquinone biosynthesis protein UbiJ
VVPDLHLSLSPLNLPAFLADPRKWSEYVQEDGDAALGGTLKELAQTLPWFVEKGFARVLGPIAGQRVADVGRRLLGFPEYAAERVTESVARYARDEAQLLARGEELRRFTDEARDVAARVDALAARVAALSNRARPD